MPNHPRTITDDLEVWVVMCWVETDPANLVLLDAYLAERFPEGCSGIEAKGNGDRSELVDAEGGLVRQ